MLFALQIITPVALFAEHELTVFGVGIVARVTPVPITPPASTGTNRTPVVAISLQSPAGAYTLTCPFDGLTSIAIAPEATQADAIAGFGVGVGEGVVLGVGAGAKGAAFV